MLKRVRIGAASMGVAAALVITGCSSDGGDGGSGGKSTGAPTGSSTASKGTGGDTGSGSGSGGVSGNLEGSWVAKAQGKSVALLVSGKKVALVGEHVCSGTAGDEAGMKMLALKCADGNTDRTMGRIKSLDATTLKVSWKGFGDDTFSRTDNGKLPSGFPTVGLPTS